MLRWPCPLAQGLAACQFCHRIDRAFRFRKTDEPARGKFPMSHVTYKIVQHDSGGPYTYDGVFSESFPSHAKALAAARRAAAEQRVPGRTEAIEYETADGKWHTETVSGNDRPDTDVQDAP